MQDARFEIQVQQIVLHSIRTAFHTIDPFQFCELQPPFSGCCKKTTESLVSLALPRLVCIMRHEFSAS
jgi:hypothetical protein